MSASATPKPSMGLGRFKKAFNGRLFYSVSLITFAQVNFGMDLGAFGGTQAMPFFKRQFGELDPITQKYVLESQYLSLLNALPYIGWAFGIVSGSYISSRFGRRMCFWVMAGWAILGAVLLVTAHSKAQMLAGRIIAYIYIGIELAVVPVIQSELVPADVRGFVCGTYALGLLAGQLIQNGICRSTSTMVGNKSWRIPFGVLFVIPVLLIAGLHFLPESPRWLLTKGRKEEALTNLRIVRQGNFTEDEIDAEFKALQSTVDLTVEKGRFHEIFQKTNLKRTAIVVGTNMVVQSMGQVLWTQYGTLYIQSLGEVNPFTMTIINTSITIPIMLVGQYLSDIVGRVPLLMISSTFQVAICATMGALGSLPSASQTSSTRLAATLMLTLYGACLQFSWSPLFHAIVAEIPTQRLRDQTYALGCVANILTQWAFSFSMPYLLFNPRYLGPKVGYIFCGTSLFSLFFAYFCIPECRGKTLEEIDGLFLEGVPVRKFRNAVPQVFRVDLLESAEKGDIGCVETEIVGAVHDEDVRMR